MQNIGSDNIPLKVSISQRTGGGVSDDHIMDQNKRYPNHSIKNISEMFTQTIKCFNSTSSNISYTHYTMSNVASLRVDILDPASSDVRAPVMVRLKSS
jgi:hypothetical protein